jgi:hypothetical protein
MRAEKTPQASAPNFSMSDGRNSDQPPLRTASSAFNSRSDRKMA